MNVNWRGAVIYLLILVAAGALILGVFPMNTTQEEIPISELAQDVEKGIVKEILVEENTLEITYQNSETVPSRKETGVDLAENLLAEHTPGEQTFALAAKAAADMSRPITDVRGSAGYQQAMVRTLTLRGLRAVWAQIQESK